MIEVILLNKNVGGGGEGHIEISNDASSYTSLEIPIIYDDQNPPGWKATDASITVVIKPASNQAPHIGTEYFLDDFTFDGITDVKISEENIPYEFSLQQNYPNPFNPLTNIKFSLPEESFVTLKIFNLQGEAVTTLVNENLSTGSYTADWDASNMPSGVYVYTLHSKSINLSRKMILMK